MKFYGSLALSLLLGTTAFAGGEVGNLLRAFEDKPGFVQPLATSMGSLMNAGWYTSSRVGTRSGWNFAMPIMLTYISEEDHYYKYTYATGCKALRDRGEVGSDCPESLDEQTISKAPTMWGPNSSERMVEVGATSEEPGDLNPHDNYTVTRTGPIIDGGISSLRKYTTLPFLAPQFAFSMQNFKGTLRGFLAPIPDLSIYSIGLGLQYDPSRFIPGMERNGFNTSLGFSISKWHLGYTPGGDFDGELGVDGLAYQPALLAGWRSGVFEVFTEIGYEFSSFKSSGTLTDNGTDVAAEDRIIKPKVEVDGRNGFRMSLNFALHLGVWHPVLGQSYGAQIGTVANVISFGKEGAQ